MRTEGLLSSAQYRKEPEKWIEELMPLPAVRLAGGHVTSTVRGSKVTRQVGVRLA